MAKTRPVQLTSELELGHPAIDGQHRILLALANEVSLAIQTNLPEHDVAMRLAILEDSTQTHFLSEEGLMLASGYDQYEAHKANHDYLMEQFQIARQQIESGIISPSELLDFYIRAWATHHIVTFDVEFAKHLEAASLSNEDGSIVA
jgi:hemerythrin